MCFLHCIYNGGSIATSFLSHPPVEQAVHPCFNVLQSILESHKTLGEEYDNASEFEHFTSQEEGTHGHNVVGLKRKKKGIGYVSLTHQWSNFQHQHMTLPSVKYLVISHFSAST